MPVFVDEVVVSVVIDNQEAGGAESQPPALEDKQRLVDECVERVMEILEQKRER